ADVDFSPDGALVAAITTDGFVKVWNRRISSEAALFPPRPATQAINEWLSAADRRIAAKPPRQPAAANQEIVREPTRKPVAAANPQIAVGRGPEAVVDLAKESAAHPADSLLALKLSALQAWFGMD